jgi:nitrite reductase (NO-forming)
MSERKVLYASLLIVVAAILSACGGGGGAPPPPGGGGQTVTISGTEFSYTPNMINAQPGEKVTVNFKNTGTVQHTFVIHDLNFKLTADPGATVTGSFTAPSQPGTFEIQCDVPGHKEAGMTGKLTVGPPAS